MIKVSQIAYAYTLSNSTTLEDVSFCVDNKTIVSIIGPSGSGKTTLLKLIAHELIPNNGTIDILKSQTPYLAPTSPKFLSYRNSIHNSLLAIELRREITKDDQVKAKTILKNFDLSTVLNKQPDQLSFGMQERLSLAQSLLINSEIILLDEPFSGLDVKTRRRAEAATSKYCKHEAKTIIIVTHNIETAVALSDKIIIISGAPWHRTKEMNVTKLFNTKEIDPIARRKNPAFGDAVLTIQQELLTITEEDYEKE